MFKFLLLIAALLLSGCVHHYMTPRNAGQACAGRLNHYDANLQKFACFPPRKAQP